MNCTEVNRNGCHYLSGFVILDPLQRTSGKWGGAGGFEIQDVLGRVEEGGL